ncbi:MAG TPA: 50S ribosomal protein L7ae-like protein, partial [Clostridium sp.]|nr:50S ribosomal protein L7ae-like protein [Clostridium sp.]
KYCADRKVPVIGNISKDELGIAIGREEINVLAVKDDKICENLIKLWKENYGM